MDSSVEKGEVVYADLNDATIFNEKQGRAGLYRNATEARMFRRMDIYLLPFVSLLYLLSFL